VVLQSINLSAQITVTALKTSIAKAEILSLASAHAQVFFSSSDFALKATESSSQVAILAEFSIRATTQVSLVRHLAIKSTL